MSNFGVLITFYIFFLLATAIYVGINIYHLIKYRLGFRGDKTSAAIAVYLLIIIVILTISWMGAFPQLFING